MLQARAVEGSGHVGGVLGEVGVEGRSAAGAAEPVALPVVVTEEALFFGVLFVDRIADHDGASGHAVAAFDQKVFAMAGIGGGVLCAGRAAAAGTSADSFLGDGCLDCGGRTAAAGGCLVFVAQSRCIPFVCSDDGWFCGVTAWRHCGTRAGGGCCRRRRRWRTPSPRLRAWG